MALSHGKAFNIFRQERGTNEERATSAHATMLFPYQRNEVSTYQRQEVGRRDKEGPAVGITSIAPSLYVFGHVLAGMKNVINGERVTLTGRSFLLSLWGYVEAGVDRLRRERAISTTQEEKRRISKG